MPETFTKLFGSILASTVWQEPDATRLTWITMLAMADKEGLVSASVPGLAHMARVSVPQCEEALRTFLAPDPYSRTPDHDGRRIEADAGGWRLLNHAMYRAIRDSEDRREYQRQWDRDNRKRNPTKSDSGLSDSDESDPARPNPTHTEADTEADTTRARAKATVQQAAQAGIVLDQLPAVLGKPKAIARLPRTADRFPEFWSVYPEKKGRAAAEKKWRARGLDQIADRIIDHVRKMIATDIDWKRGYVPHGSTYINGDRWEDVPKTNGPPAASPPGKTMQAIQALQEMKNGLALNRDHDGVSEAALLEFGKDSGGRGNPRGGSGLV